LLQVAVKNKKKVVTIDEVQKECWKRDEPVRATGDAIVKKPLSHAGEHAALARS